MWRSVIRVGAAVALFAVVHSVLASRPAKQAAARVFGERNRNGLYRPFYIGQSLVTFGLLVLYIRRQPSAELYCVRGPLAYVMLAGQGAALLWLIAAARQVGILRITGAKNLLVWSDGERADPEPEAQGPALDAEGLSTGPGPFAYTRHPLNFGFLPIFWLWPRMTTNLLTFNLAATLYLVAGSVHEEIRLRKAYGSLYGEYERSGVPFFLPHAPPSLSALPGSSLNAPSPFADSEDDRPALPGESTEARPRYRPPSLDPS
jgi:protein-S-isoprenylcysteine O-methyltransferase Ste14